MTPVPVRRAQPLSVFHLTALDASPEEFVDHARAAGFGAVGLRINPPPHTPTPEPPPLDRATPRQSGRSRSP